MPETKKTKSLENETKEEKLKEKVETKEIKEVEKIEKLKFSIDSFLEDNIQSRKKRGLNFAFKTWYKFKQNGSFHDKKTINDWENLLKKFINEPTKN